MIEIWFIMKGDLGVIECRFLDLYLCYVDKETQVNDRYSLIFECQWEGKFRYKLSTLHLNPFAS